MSTNRTFAADYVTVLIFSMSTNRTFVADYVIVVILHDYKETFHC